LYLSGEIAKMGSFELLTDGSDIPVLAFKLKEESNFSVFDISEMVRDRGWLVPAYTMPANDEDVAVLRIVVKEGFSRDMADLLLGDLARILKHFADQPGNRPKKPEKRGKYRKHC